MLDHLTTRRTLYEAFGRVKENGGCRGADGVTLGEFEGRLEWELDRIESSLLHRRYHPFPLLRIEIPKPSGGLRYLAVPTVRDRVVQSAVYLVTKNLFEKEFEECSHAYREGRSVRTAVAQIDALRRKGYRWVVDADIDSFFDNIPHQRLLTRLQKLALDPYLLRLFELWIQAEIYDGRRIFRLAQGIPQGSVVSPMLANLFLDELDEHLALFGQKVVRYADDFLILCKSPEQAAEALEITEYLLEELELRLNREKTVTTTFEGGFKFLGVVFLKDALLVPFQTKKKKDADPVLPPPLDLLTYLELREEVEPSLGRTPIRFEAGMNGPR